jgi:hypothetical protein
MRLGSILLIVGFVSFAAYAGLFYWTLAKAGRDQVERYNSTFAKSKINLVGAALVAGAFLVPNTLFATILGLCAFAWIGRATFMQRARMREMLFDAGFESRLFAISFLAAVAISCLLAGKLWFQTNAS